MNYKDFRPRLKGNKKLAYDNLVKKMELDLNEKTKILGKVRSSLFIH